MTEYKILGQNAPSADTETNLYTTPSGSATVVRAINVTNTASSADTFDIAINDSAIVPVPTDTFAAVAQGTAAAASSTDGITWTAGTLPSSTNWRSVAYGNGTFAAVAFASA